MTLRIGFLEVVSCLFALAPAVLCMESQTGPLTFEFQKFESQWPNMERKFYIHSKEHPQGLEFGILEQPPDFKNATETKIITHGYKENRHQIQMIVDEYIQGKNANIITFDWSFGAHLNELQAAIFATYFGKFVIGSFVNRLMKKYDVKPEQIHLIGYSMGAHLMGCAGKFQKPLIGRITGLDPYKAYYNKRSLLRMPGLKASDAKFVDVFHTNGGNLGLAGPIGTVDFYPNGGTLQPKCIEDKSRLCNSIMAKEYFAESIKFRDNFWGVESSRYEDFKSKKLPKNAVMVIAGEFGNKTVHGTFYFQTNAKSPYGRQRRGTNPE